ncbi:MAG TPA: FMN-binding protein [Acidimicrobiales bacterium]|nr:FMN-binding protein [Acidimicrobiales bacterium]
MRRYQLVLGGTVAGTAAVLAFPTAHPALHAASATGPATAAAGSTAATTPAPAAPATTAPGSSGTTPGATAPATSPPTASATRSATSTTESFRYGDMAVKVTVDGTKITRVGIASIDETDGRSRQIDAYAVPVLEQQVVSAGSANIDGVSGATFTSQAFVDAVANALGKLGISS